jgi:hypothetical protein
MTADEIIRTLSLAPHPEGGWFKETFRDAGAPRGASTAIYYLLKAGERSHWHRIDAAELWHWYAGAPLELRIAGGARRETHVLGTALAKGERPQTVVPPHAWQSARSLGEFTLVGCTVAPAFDFAKFEMAPPGWEPD